MTDFRDGAVLATPDLCAALKRSILNKVKKRLRNMRIFVSFTKLLRAPFSENICQQIILKIGNFSFPRRYMSFEARSCLHQIVREKINFAPHIKPHSQHFLPVWGLVFMKNTRSDGNKVGFTRKRLVLYTLLG